MTVGVLQDKNILTIHFLFETITIQEGESSQECEIVQLVRPGQTLVSIPENARNAKKEAAIKFVAAENCTISPDGASVLAAATGYPAVDLQENNGRQEVSVAVTPLVTVSEDAMKAVMTLYPPVSGGAALQAQDLLLYLQEAGVVFGIDQRLLHKGLEKVGAARQPVRGLVVARGLQPVNGVDAHLRMEVETGALPGRIRGDGSIDFKERRMFVNVEEGELIATKIRETKGMPGKTVLGQAVPQKEGRDITVRVTEDAMYSEKERTVRAAKAGVVSIVKDSTIKVSSKLTLPGDVDLSTGNIYSKNAVEIGGSVKPGFVVAVRGDLLINGDIQSATLSSHGNLTVKGGIVGAGTTITIRGDADINFIENGTLHAGGNVVVRKSVYYSTIVAGGNIVGDEKTKIMGSVLACNGSIAAGDIGSRSADPASITAGTDVTRYQHFLELHHKVIDLEKETAHWLQQHGTEAQKSSKMLAMEQELLEARAELSTLNLIPGTPDDSASDDLLYDDDAEITVYGQVFQGTELRIGNVTRTLVLHHTRKRFKINKETNTIVDQPL